MAEVPTVIAGVGVCASICRCFTGDNICCRMCKRCCKSKDTSDSPGQSTSARISNWIFDICNCKNCKCISCGHINCCSCHKSVTEPTDPQSKELMATERRQRSSDVREATASGDENTSLLATAEVHQGNVKPTAPPEEGTGLDSSTVTNQPTSRVSLAIDMSHGRQPTHITASSAARGKQTSAGQDATDAAQPPSLPTSHGTPASTVPSASNEQHPPMNQQPLAPAEAQPASLPTSHGTPASTVPSASNEQHPPMNQPVAPAEAQPPARNPPPVTSFMEISDGQDSTDAAEPAEQMAAQPATSTAATSETQTSAGQDSVDATVAGSNQHESIGHHTVPTSHGTPAFTVPSASSERQPPMRHQPAAPAQPASLPTSHGTPASTVPSASNEQHPPMNQQPLAPAEAQPPTRNPPQKNRQMMVPHRRESLKIGLGLARKMPSRSASVGLPRNWDRNGRHWPQS